MAIDKLKGKSNQAIGKAKEILGKVTGNENLEGEGAAQKVEGKAQDTVGRLKDKVEQAKQKLR